MVKNLRHLREIHEISQMKLAELLNLSQQSIHKYETSSTEPDIATLCILADFFHTSVDYLVGRAAYPEVQEGNSKDLLSGEDVALLCCYSDLAQRTKTCVLDLVKDMRDLTVAAAKSKKGAKSKQQAKANERKQPVTAGQPNADKRPD